MTDVNNQTLSSNADDPLIRTYYLCCALQISEFNVTNLIRKGRLPAPDVVRANYRQWRLSTIRKANPALADSIEILLKIPRTAVA